MTVNEASSFGLTTDVKAVLRTEALALVASRSANVMQASRQSDLMRETVAAQIGPRTEPIEQAIRWPWAGRRWARTTRQGIKHRTVCEHPFVTSQGSAQGRFQKACDHGNVVMAEHAVHELPKPVSLVNALRLVRLYATAGSPKFERAALRLLSRIATETPITLDEARVAAGWLADLAGPDGDQAVMSLGVFVYGRPAPDGSRPSVSNPSSVS